MEFDILKDLPSTFSIRVQNIYDFELNQSFLKAYINNAINISKKDYRPQEMDLKNDIINLDMIILLFYSYGYKLTNILNLGLKDEGIIYYFSK